MVFRGDCMNVLVTGASGLIGSNLFRKLKDDGYDVVGISTKDGDLRDKEFLKKIIDEYRSFHNNTNCFFKDDASNNFIVSDDYSDFRILDFGSLRYDENKEIRIRSLMDGIGGVNGNDDMHIFGKPNFTQKDKFFSQ